jgi:glycosyltransferase involved in cell wall biosynthesis
LSAASDAPRVVITHDFMETYGGAERVTAEMATAFPDAPVVAILGREDVAERMGVGDRFRSLLKPRPALLRHYRYLAPLFGAYTDHVKLAEADVVLSSSYAFAHRLRSRNDAPRVCYCHSALRFAWSMTESYKDERAGNPVAGAAFEAFAAMMRRSDKRSAQPIREYLTQSPFTAEQIERFYERPVEVIGAPVDCELFRPDPSGAGADDYYLFCGRLIEPYKQVGIAIEAFRRTGQRLVVAGGGPDFERLSANAPPNVEFLGHVADDVLVPLMQRCQALVFPSRDDFGLIPVEVMACGRPVLAYADGGSLYTSKPGVTGELFDVQSADAIEAALRSFDPGSYEPEKIRAHALQWDSPRFRERLIRHVEQAAQAA